MTEISMLDKIKVLFTMTKSNMIFPVIIVFLLFISFLFITTNKNNSKNSKKVYIMIYLGAFLVLILKYKDNILKMFDYMMNNLFIVFYFPNIAVYLGAIIATNIIMWISMFSNKSNMIIKTINTIMFSIIHYIFILILSIVNKNNINVFDQLSMYSNNEIHSLIELSSNIFIIWILFLIIYKIITYYIFVKSNKKVEKLSVEHRGASTSTNLVNKFIKEVDAPIMVKRDNTKKYNNAVFNYIKEVNVPLVIKRQKSNNTIQEDTTKYQNILTVNDYKKVLEILNSDSSIVNSENNDNTYNLDTEEKPVLMQNINKAGNSELLDLYKRAE